MGLARPGRTPRVRTAFVVSFYVSLNPLNFRRCPLVLFRPLSLSPRSCAFHFIFLHSTHVVFVCPIRASLGWVC